MFFCILAFSVAYSLTLQKTNTELVNNLKQVTKKLIKSERNEHSLIQNYIYSNRHINDSIGFVYNFAGCLDKINNMFSNSDSVILICRISETHCSSCTQYAVSLAKETRYPRLIYLANNNKYSLLNLSRSFIIDTCLIRGTEIELSDADRLLFPYFLFVSSNDAIQAVYIPFENNDEADQSMLALILDKLNNKLHRNK